MSDYTSLSKRLSAVGIAPERADALAASCITNGQLKLLISQHVMYHGSQSDIEALLRPLGISPLDPVAQSPERWEQPYQHQGRSYSWEDLYRNQLSTPGALGVDARGLIEDAIRQHPREDALAIRFPLAQLEANALPSCTTPIAMHTSPHHDASLAPCPSNAAKSPVRGG